MKKRSPERPQTFRASFLFRGARRLLCPQEKPLYKMLSDGGGTGKIIMQKIHP